MSYEQIDYHELREAIQQDMRNTALVMAAVILGTLSLVMFSIAAH